MIGTMERNVGGILIYRHPQWFFLLDCRVCPFEQPGTLPLSFNIWQNIGQLKIFFLAHGS